MTWVAPKQCRSSLKTSLCLLDSEVQLQVFHQKNQISCSNVLSSLWLVLRWSERSQLGKLVSHIARTRRHRSRFICLMRTRGNHPCAMFVATAVVISQTLVEASFLRISCANVCYDVHHNWAQCKFHFCNPLINYKASGNPNTILISAHFLFVQSVSVYWLMARWCGKYHWSLSLVWFSSSCSILQTNLALTSVSKISW